MILIGVVGCELCDLAHRHLPDYRYLKLNKISENQEQRIIKRKLFKLNISGNFPVAFSDDFNIFHDTNWVLTKMNLNKILSDERTNKKSDI